MQGLFQLSDGVRIHEGAALAFAATTLESFSIGDQMPTGEADAASLKPSLTLPGSLARCGAAGVRAAEICL
tara:strand:- start:1239 stop:1451 length:213 start_codon:yes stop_codon:yes gene_type:complete